MKPIKLTLFLFSFLLLSLISSSYQQPPSLPSSVIDRLTSREMRYHHFLFHNVRNLWNSLSTRAQNQLRDLGWQPPRPAKDRNGRAITNNNAGEDFLYMHRKMIEMVNGHMRRAGASNVTGFTSIPAANDRTFPMPPAYTGPNSDTTNLVSYYKTASWYNYARRIETRLKDPSFLRTMTLGELGAYIEFSSDIHQGMHFRFSSRNSLMRPKSSPVMPNIDRRWDVRTNNWLVDLYSSHLNPWFFKLHGWIDDRINDWARANNVRNINWRGTWTGGNLDRLPDNLNIPADVPSRFLRNGKSMEDMDMEAQNADDSGCVDMGPLGTMNVTAMEEAVKMLIMEGVCCDYYSDLNKGKARTPLKCLSMLNRLMV